MQDEELKHSESQNKRSNMTSLWLQIEGVSDDHDQMELLMCPSWKGRTKSSVIRFKNNQQRWDTYYQPVCTGAQYKLTQNLINTFQCQLDEV
jgi:hypothetical protein